MELDLLNLFLTALPYLGVGFAAQAIDGALGMAYGVSSTSLLLATGASPAVASASVHTAEVFTTAASGLAHLRLGNVDRSMLRTLIFPGVLGGVLGAYVLTSVQGDLLKPFIALYLFLMGALIVLKSLRNRPAILKKTPLAPLGLAGGFLDAVGGGGWGPVVTSTLVARGNTPRFSIGSVNAAEFFVTFAEAVTFVVTIGFVNLPVVLGLIVGGVIAAPMGAYVCKRLPARAMMLGVGTLIMGLSVRTLWLSWL
jgi:uncharacterized membrane protein YfcA